MTPELSGTLAVTTICRGSLPGEPTGYLTTISLDERRVTGRAPIPDPRLLRFDPNPRGGMRGARGMALWDGDLLVANFSQIFRFNSRWQLVDTLSDPACADIHDIATGDGGIWVTSTAGDQLVQLSPDGTTLDSFRVRLDATDEAALTAVSPIDLRDPRTYCAQRLDRLHLNSVALSSTGDPLTVLGLIQRSGGSAILDLGHSGARTFATSGGSVPVHSLRTATYGVLLADTPHGQLVYLSEGSQFRIDVQGGYLRGVCPFAPGRAAVGTQNHVQLVNLVTGTVIGTFDVSANSQESVYDIMSLPDDFGPAPTSLCQ